MRIFKMINILKDKEIQWTEPKNLDKLKRNLKDKSKNTFMTRNWAKLLIFLLIFSFLFLYWYGGGKFMGREMKLVPVLIICISVSFLFVQINDVMFKIFGYCIVTLRDDYIYYNRSMKNSKQWNIKNIQACKIITGLYKSKSYKAFLITYKKNKSQIFIINNNIKTEKILQFFKNRGLECREDILNF